VQTIVALPRQSAPVVDNRSMPDVNLQHQLALMLQDGTATFHSSHDRARMNDPAIVALRGKIRIDPRNEETFVENSRQAWVHVELADGRRLDHKTLYVRGTPNNPMTLEEVVAKSRDLMDPIISAKRSQKAIEMLLSLEEIENIGSLRDLITPLEFPPSR